MARVEVLKVFLGSLQRDAYLPVIHRHMHDAGLIAKEIYVPYQKNPADLGVAFATFETEEEAALCIEWFHGSIHPEMTPTSVQAGMTTPYGSLYLFVAQVSCCLYSLGYSL